MDWLVDNIWIVFPLIYLLLHRPSRWRRSSRKVEAEWLGIDDRSSHRL